MPPDVSGVFAITASLACRTTGSARISGERSRSILARRHAANTQSMPLPENEATIDGKFARRPDVYEMRVCIGRFGMNFAHAASRTPQLRWSSPRRRAT